MRSFAAACIALTAACGDIPPPAGVGEGDAGTANEPKLCSSDRDCASGETCNNGLCGGRPTCARDADCAPGYRCNLFAAVCVEDPTADAGHTSDAGSGTDAGGSSDAGVGDSGGGSDASVGGDAGSGTDAGGPQCADDLDCNPPASICSYGDCVDGCTVTGCYYGEVCRSDGRCSLAAADGGTGDAVGGTPDGGDGGATDGGGSDAGSGGTFAPGDLGAACARDLDCDSDYCYVAPGEQDGWCTQLCSASWQCAPDFRCGEDSRFPDTMFCFHESLYGTDVPDTEMGSPCAGSADCKSGFCLGIGVCSDTCGVDADCDTGWSCVADFVDIYDAVPLCLPDSALSGKTRTTGALCSNKCNSLACDANGDYCADLCCTSRDCPLGSVCLSQQLYGIPGNDGYSDNFMKACWVTGVTSVTQQMGDACNPQQNGQCRGPCLDFGDGKGPYCTDTCCLQEDCPDGWRCQAIPGPASTVQFCMKP
jgi:hypothetical protein